MGQDAGELGRVAGEPKHPEVKFQEDEKLSGEEDEEQTELMRLNLTDVGSAQTIDGNFPAHGTQKSLMMP